MTPMILESYVAGAWTAPGGEAVDLAHAATGEVVARAARGAPDASEMLSAARAAGAGLREMGFHDRARALKALAGYLMERKAALYEISAWTGATKGDSWIDIDGGIGTCMVYASKGRRELPDGRVWVDGDIEQLSRGGTFLGAHVMTPLQGAAVQINAFNFPVWGMLEKFAPAFLAGVPSIVKPATQTSYLTEACVRMMVESGILPEGSIQLIIGGVGDLLDHLGPQDGLAFTGSAATGLKLRSHPSLLANAVRFTAEQDSLNGSILGPDAAPGSAEFDLFVKEAAKEITTKAGQKCTATRRLIVPVAHVDAVAEALSARLSKTTVGDPTDEATRMGPVVSLAQLADVIEKAGIIGQHARLILGDGAISGSDKGAFIAPRLYQCDDPDAATAVHETEAFGPVSTLMPYRDLSHATEIANRGGGSLVASLFTHDTGVASEVIHNSAAWHGRIYINNRDSADEATGHGSPLPHMVHGGPGRAGGGEELGGVRAVAHYMQRTAVQGSPKMLTAIGGTWVKGAEEREPGPHPFTKTYHDLSIGESIVTEPRTVSLEDIEQFAHFTGDLFYGHMDEEAAKANPFFPGRVAHGYLILSFAAGLFVEPSPGPVLANTGIGELAFQKPLSPGEALHCRLTVKKKTRRTETYGEVRWNVTVWNQDKEQVAEYELLTMVAYEYPLAS
ncbi:MAG: phenylacetic acid degradation bifunctional protein PaaZ [Pseudomonadota bacterium]